MKNKFIWLTIVFFVLLVFASIFAFFLIFGLGFGGSLNFKAFLSLGILAAIWAVTYIRLMPLENKKYRVLFSLSGTVIIYNIFLSTLFVDPRATQSIWLFLGTPVAMLAIWYLFVHEAYSENTTMHWLVWTLFFGIILFYAWHITFFYYANVFG